MSDSANEQKIKKALRKYCEEVNKYYKAGNIESSYNKPVIDLIQAFECTAHDFSGARSGDNGENIDIKLWHLEDDINKTPTFGAIEVKKVGGKDERARKQILIEAKKFGNVILTDNTTWEFYNDESEKMYNGFRLLEKNSANEFEIDEEKIELFISSIKDFVLKRPSNIKNSGKLAFYMAEYAKTIKTIVYNILNSGNDNKPMYTELFALYSRLQQDLLPDLTIRDFSDMYAQTIVYGLFIARYNDTSVENFSRGEAISNLTRESHLLKQFFQHVATSDNLHPTLDDSINKLCDLFALTDLKKLLDQYEKKDAIVHFYEDFLEDYDLKQKKDFGAYYTPVPVVDYMVRMVDELLIKEFNIDNGFANNETINITVKSDEYVERKKVKNEKEIAVPKVAILDPACGTGTFSAEIIKYVKEKYFSGGNEVFYSKWLHDKNSLISRLISFEIMMTSYVIAHLKMRRTLKETLNDDQIDRDIKTNIFLTNTLAEPKSIFERNAQISFFDFSGAITEEAEQADKWKCRRPIQVIIGNPPYLAASKNKYDISEYKYETDGKTKLNERNPKWLNDDYVKFIRFSEKHIKKDGKGILAFITNNGYLDNPTFRGMRASLLRTFDKIYILNLHGNSIKQETTPDGSKDENVFNIRIGVAIIIGIKTSSNEEWGELKYADLYGTRKSKFAELESNNIDFKEVIPDEKMAMFIPQEDKELKEEYDKGVNLVELFNTYSAGVVTGRDSLTIKKDKEDIKKVVEDLSSCSPEEIRTKYDLGKDTDWTIKGAIDDINEGNGKFQKIAYRIFDDRWTYYTGKQNGFYCRARNEVMNNFDMVDENYGLIITRGDAADRPFSMAFVTNKIVDAHITAAPTIATIIPLYIKDAMIGKIANYNKNNFDKLVVNLKTQPTDQEVFDYCYGILFDNEYRTKYNSFLKQDFPKVPIIENEEMFNKYVKKGSRLRKLHLMEEGVQRELEVESSNNNLLLEMSKYQNGSLRINKDTIIKGISEEVYTYSICGYQVIDKWIKSHKGENMTLELFNHLKKMVGIIEETIKTQTN